MYVFKLAVVRLVSEKNWARYDGHIIMTSSIGIHGKLIDDWNGEGLP